MVKTQRPRTGEKQEANKSNPFLPDQIRSDQMVKKLIFFFEQVKPHDDSDGAVNSLYFTPGNEKVVNSLGVDKKKEEESGKASEKVAETFALWSEESFLSGFFCHVCRKENQKI